jgi:hypothetical protein
MAIAVIDANVLVGQGQARQLTTIDIHDTNKVFLGALINADE